MTLTVPSSRDPDRSTNDSHNIFYWYNQSIVASILTIYFARITFIYVAITLPIYVAYPISTHTIYHLRVTLFNLAAI